MGKKTKTNTKAAAPTQPTLPPYIYGREAEANEKVWPEAAVRAYGDARAQAVLAQQATQVCPAPDANGFEVSSPCGRTWFIPLEKVLEDYASFLRQADGLSLEDSLKQAREYMPHLESWFAEQFSWEDVDNYGVLLKQPTPEEVALALDFYRRNASGGPADEYKVHGRVA